VIGVRDYQSGDGFRSVHWKATARMGSLQVKQYEPTRSMSLVFCLNIASFDQHWQGVWPELVEHLLVVAASLAAHGLDQGYAVGIIANATLSHADRSLRVPPSRHRAQLTHLLELLAGISYFVSDDYARFLLAESTRLPWGATLVLITGLLGEEIMAAIWQLQRSGRRIVLIAVGKVPPPQDIPGVLTYHLPVEADEPIPDAPPPSGAQSQPPKATQSNGQPRKELPVPVNRSPTPRSANAEAPTEPPNPATETPRQRYLRERAERARIEAEQTKETIR
jgi:hypothetical protein